MTKRLAVQDEERRSVSNLAAVLLELAVRDREGWIESRDKSAKKDRGVA